MFEEKQAVVYKKTYNLQNNIFQQNLFSSGLKSCDIFYFGKFSTHNFYFFENICYAKHRYKNTLFSNVNTLCEVRTFLSALYEYLVHGQWNVFFWSCRHNPTLLSKPPCGKLNPDVRRTLSILHGATALPALVLRYEIVSVSAAAAPAECDTPLRRWVPAVPDFHPITAPYIAFDVCLQMFNAVFCLSITLVFKYCKQLASIKSPTVSISLPPKNLLNFAVYWYFTTLYFCTFGCEISIGNFVNTDPLANLQVPLRRRD